MRGLAQQAAAATGLRFLGHVVVADMSWKTVPNYLGMNSLRIERTAEC